MEDFSSLPRELQKFKELLHPTRLAIMLILSKHFKVAASEMRRSLGISWGAFYSHAQTLQKSNYISFGKEFKGETPQLVLLLEEEGERKLKQFKQIWDKL